MEKAVGDLSAVILAGGLGTRLRAVVNDRPKVMAMVAGRPFAEWVVLGLQSAGVRHLIFCIGYLGEMVQEYFQNGSAWGMTIEYSHDKTLLGTGGALRQCFSLVRSDPVLVVNGDSYCHVNVQDYLEWFSAMRRVGAMVVVKSENPERFGSVQMASDCSIIGFEEKVVDLNESWINAGCYLMSQELLSSIHSNQPVSLERDILPQYVNRGLWGFPSFGSFVDMGTPHGLCEAEDLFLTCAS